MGNPDKDAFQRSLDYAAALRNEQKTPLGAGLKYTTGAVLLTGALVVGIALVVYGLLTLL